MKLHCISCETLTRVVYHGAALSPHSVDITLLPVGLHDHPDGLRAHLQEAVDHASYGAASGGSCEAIVLGYGLCGRALAGLTARGVPLVLPRAHDCITLFLGSRRRYQQQFESVPGTYWYAQDYIERGRESGSFGMGAQTAGDLQAMYEKYLQKYGKARADRLMEAMGALQQHYQRAVYLDTGLGDGAAVEAEARAEAARRGWVFERLQCDLTLMARLLSGEWNSGNDFLIVPPGQRVEMSYDESIVCAVKSP